MTLQVTSFRGKFETGLILQIHPQTITMFTTPINKEPRHGSFRVGFLRNGKQPVLSCGFMESVCLPRRCIISCANEILVSQLAQGRVFFCTCYLDNLNWLV